MVEVKYSALYTDNLGCEQAELYFFKGGLQLKVRNSNFYDDNFNFDFYTKNPDKIGRSFYLKDDELIEYIIDIKIPLIVTRDGKEYVKEAMLSVERHKNSYNNSLSLTLNGKLYEIKGYNLQELLRKMDEKLPKEYIMKDDFSCKIGVYSIENNKENNLYCLNIFRDDYKNISKKDSYLELFNIENKKNFKELQKIPITFIYTGYVDKKVET